MGSPPRLRPCSRACACDAPASLMKRKVAACAERTSRAARPARSRPAVSRCGRPWRWRPPPAGGRLALRRGAIGQGEQQRDLLAATLDAGGDARTRLHAPHRVARQGEQASPAARGPAPRAAIPRRGLQVEAEARAEHHAQQRQRLLHAASGGTVARSSASRRAASRKPRTVVSIRRTASSARSSWRRGAPSAALRGQAARGWRPAPSARCSPRAARPARSAAAGRGARRSTRRRGAVRLAGQAAVLLSSSGAPARGFRGRGLRQNVADKPGRQGTAADVQHRRPVIVAEPDADDRAAAGKAR